VDPSLSTAAIRVPHPPTGPPAYRCPKCGSARTCLSRRRSFKDWLLLGLFMDAYRCTQCLRRFFRFRSRRVSRFVTVSLFLVPVIVLTLWFLELRSLQRVRALSAPEPVKQDQPKTGSLSPSAEDLLKTR
jgi:hypothetical protein